MVFLLHAEHDCCKVLLSDVMGGYGGDPPVSESSACPSVRPCQPAGCMMQLYVSAVVACHQSFKRPPFLRVIVALLQ